jgi:hypothetical protein
MRNQRRRMITMKKEQASENNTEQISSAPAKPANKKTVGKKELRKASKASKRKKATSTKSTPKATDRASKKGEVIAMMKRSKGVTLAEIMSATNWQAHTVRGFVSILGGKGGEKIESAKNEKGERVYRIAK